MAQTHTSVPRAPSNKPAWLTAGVLGIGLASLLSDWGHEAATAILPVFLASLGAPAVALGVIEGLSDGLSSFAKLAGGFAADHARWRKPTGVIGYCGTAVTTFGYAFARSWPMVLLLRALGWVGRGGRGPSRDALLADCVRPGQEGRAFGFERAMDTLGAVLGPLSATALLGVLGMPGVLRWTLLPGLAAAVCFALLAPGAKKLNGRQAPPISSLGSRLRQLPQSYWRFLSGVFAHGVGDFAPTLLILRASQVLTSRYGGARAAMIAVGLYTFFNVVNAAATYPAGALADRAGKRGLLAAGYAVGALTYIGFLFERPVVPVLAVLFGLAGLHGAVQASLEKSITAELLPKEVRGSGFGVLAAANGVGDLVSSIAVGALWSTVSPASGFLYAGAFAALGAALIYFSGAR